MKSIVIIGGGAAGLMAAVSASNSDCKITVIEKNERPARKLMITGKGRCNVTNNCDNDTLISNAVHNGRFLYSAFSAFSSADTVKFFEDCGVPLKTERGNRVFPVSDKAVDIVDALVSKAKRSASFIHARATGIKTLDGKVSSVLLDNGETIPADSVIIATGGKSYPLTGSTGDGYIIAQSLGHTVTELSPSLVRLECHEGFCTHLAGLSLKNVTFTMYENGRKKPIFSELGEMLFTHTGVSGPLVLSASARITDIKKGYIAEIDMKPALDLQQLDKRILRDFAQKQNCNFSNSLDKLLPKSLIPTVVSLSGIAPDTKVNSVRSDQRKRLAEVIKHFTLHITDLGPIEEAVVTRGGVSVKEINPATMESRLVSGLYFAGEVIDVDSYTGGFNLQTAFSTGHLAGKNAGNNY